MLPEGAMPDGRDLVAEYMSALERTKPADLDSLRRAGIGEAGFAIRPAVAPIIVTRDGLHYEPDPDGDGLAFILPVRIDNPLSPEAADPDETVRSGEIADLVAFSAAFPNRWALRTGAATWLGAVEPQYMGPAPTPIWRSPLHWLAHAEGVCLLSRDRRDQYRVLTCLDSIIAEDEGHADELRELLSRPWIAPPVFVRHGREVRHAA
jgi:hypothetical protein